MHKHQKTDLHKKPNLKNTPIMGVFLSPFSLWAKIGGILIKTISNIMTKISVLVPIYNVEKYLDECLASLKAQTLNDVEFICINDVSTDGSLSILKKYAKKDARFSIIDKKNSGYGDSMNKGLRAAKGKYIAILESDDFLEKDALERLFEVAEKHKADIVRANYFYHSEKGDEVHASIKQQKLDEPISILEDPNILYEEPAIWSAIYKRCFLTKNKINFLPSPGASYQDTSFNFKALCSAERIVYLMDAFLHYRVDNANSSVKSLEKVMCVTNEFAEIEKFFAENGIAEELAYIEQAAKFGAYHWNLQRLDRKNGLKFLKNIKEEFEIAQGKDLLKKEFFPRRWWIALRAILCLPPKLAFALLSFRIRLAKH